GLVVLRRERMADGARAAAAPARADRARGTRRSAHGVPYRHVEPHVLLLAPDRGRPPGAVRGRDRLERGLRAPAAPDDGRARRLPRPLVARAPRAPDARRLLGAASLPAPL